MKIILFTVDAFPTRLLRLRDGEFDVVPVRYDSCTMPGEPVSQVWAENVAKVPLTVGGTDAVLRNVYGMLDGDEAYTDAELTAMGIAFDALPTASGSR